MLEVNEVYFKKEIIAKNLFEYFCEKCRCKLNINKCLTCEGTDLPLINKKFQVDYNLSNLLDYMFLELRKINTDELFCEYITDCFGENISLYFGTYNLAEVIKSVDPCTYELKKYEYIQALISKGIIIGHNEDYYFLEDLIQFFIKEQTKRIN